MLKSHFRNVIISSQIKHEYHYQVTGEVEAVAAKLEALSEAVARLGEQQAVGEKVAGLDTRVRNITDKMNQFVQVDIIKLDV